MLSRLFRLLLIASLVLDGSGLAMASSMTMSPGMDTDMRMDTGAAQSSTPAVHDDMHGMHDIPVASTKPPCRGNDAGMAGAAAQHERHTDDTGDSKPAQPTPDGCHSDGCQCACAHAAQVSLALLRLPVATGRTDVPRTRASAHTAPALSHLIRPPIG